MRQGQQHAIKAGVFRRLAQLAAGPRERQAYLIAAQAHADLGAEADGFEARARLMLGDLAPQLTADGESAVDQSTGSS